MFLFISNVYKKKKNILKRPLLHINTILHTNIIHINIFYNKIYISWENTDNDSFYFAVFTFAGRQHRFLKTHCNSRFNLISRVSSCSWRPWETWPTSWRRSDPWTCLEIACIPSPRCSTSGSRPRPSQRASSAKARSATHAGSNCLSAASFHCPRSYSLFIQMCAITDTAGKYFLALLTWRGTSGLTQESNHTGTSIFPSFATEEIACANRPTTTNVIVYMYEYVRAGSGC